MADSTQHRIGRNRPPRVQITYDVEIGNAIQKTEIPFVVGIMADLSGLGDDAREDGVALKDKARSFVEIDRDNFADVMAKIAPTLTIAGSTEEGGGPLTFRSLDDFNPAFLVKQVESIRKLHSQRSALRDILTKLDSNDALYATLKTQVEENKIEALGTAASTRLAKLEAPAAENGAKPKGGAKADAGADAKK